MQVCKSLWGICLLMIHDLKYELVYEVNPLGYSIYEFCMLWGLLACHVCKDGENIDRIGSPLD